MIGSSRTVAILALVVFQQVGAAQQVPGFYDDTVVRRVDLIFKTSGYWSTLQSNYSSKTNMKCDVKVDGVTYPDCGVRFRGNSSYWGLPSSSLKRGFKVSIDEYVPDRKLLGYKTLNFNNNFADPSWCREIISYSVFRRFMPTPKCNYIHLYINGVSWGPYFNTQQVNKAMLKEWFDDNDGNRYRGERTNLGSNAAGTALTWLGSASGPYERAYELKLKNAPNPWKDLIEVCNVLNNTPSSQLYGELPKVLDVDSAIWMHANASVLIWLDSYIGRYCHNFYINSDIDNGRMVLTPWDTNGCFGGYTDGQSNVTRLTPFYQENHSSRPLYTRLMKNAKWRQRYLAHIRSIMDIEYDWANLGPRVMRYQSLIDTLVKNDNKGLYTYQNFLDNATIGVRVRSWGWLYRTIPGLRDFVNARVAYLRSHSEVDTTAPTLTELRHKPSKPTLDQDVWVTAKVKSAAAIGGATLYYRVQGPYTEATMYDDGQHGDGAANDDVWGAKIPKQAGGKKVEYYVSGRSTSANSQALTFLPRTASNRPPYYVVGYPKASDPIGLNEFLAKNVSVIRDEKNEFDDWVEITNKSTSTVTVSGMYITDEYDNPTKWQIPAGYSIPGGGKLLIWCDEDPGDGPLHANFKLSGFGEWLGLFRSDGRTMVDELHYGDQLEDISCGRLSDGALPWVTYPDSTPAASNVMFCGTRRYDSFDPMTHRFKLALTGTPKIGTSPILQLRDGPKNALGLLFFGVAGGHLPLGQDLVLLLGGPVLLGPFGIPTDANGAFDLPLPIPNSSSTIGTSAFLQVGGNDASGPTASNAVHIIVCK
ncbi:MAG: CotH kinase family protein [Planctomycetota bacterium]|nr:CotH kinase family protein [Planctomycetota bacterium]